MNFIWRQVGVILLCPIFCFASSDMDDGIAIDDSISKYHNIEKIQKNTRYITRNAISKSYTTMDSDSFKISKEKNAAVNSIILESGSRVNGDIIIIDNSNGDSTAIAK